MTPPTPPVSTAATPLLELDLNDWRRALNQLDIMGRLISQFGPDGPNMDPTTGTFAYRGALFRDDTGGMIYEPAGTIVCTDNAVRFVQWDQVNGVTQSATLDPLKFAIAQVSRGTSSPTDSDFHVEDIRGINLIPNAMRWRGDWAAGTYVRNDVVLNDGALYIALVETTDEPPTADWELIFGGSSLDVEDEGTLEESAVTRINFTGAGVTAIGDTVGGVDVDIPGAAADSLVVLRHYLKSVIPTAASNTPMARGIGDPANLGTATAGPLSNSNFNTTQVRVRQTASSTGTNENAGRSVNSTSTTILVLGDAAGLGGFSFIQRFAFATVLGVRGFFGVATANGVANSNPSSKLNILGLGFDTGDTTFFLMHNDGSGTATRTDTTVTFALDVVYEVEIECGANSSGITVALYSVNATSRTLLYGPQAVTTDLPAGSTLLSPTTSISNGAAGGTQPVLDFHFWLLDTR